MLNLISYSNGNLQDTFGILKQCKEAGLDINSALAEIENVINDRFKNASVAKRSKISNVDKRLLCPSCNNGILSHKIYKKENLKILICACGYSILEGNNGL